MKKGDFHAIMPRIGKFYCLDPKQVRNFIVEMDSNALENFIVEILKQAKNS